MRTIFFTDLHKILIDFHKTLVPFTTKKNFLFIGSKTDSQQIYNFVLEFQDHFQFKQSSHIKSFGRHISNDIYVNLVGLQMTSYPSLFFCISSNPFSVARK